MPSSDWKTFQKNVGSSQVRSCISTITKGLTPGSSAIIIAKPFSNATKIYINFSHDPVNGVLILHFNPRFKDKVIVLNTFSFNGWESERRFKTNFPFKQNVFFVLLIKCEGGQFEFILNGRPIGSYDYRVNLELSKYLTISGDLYVYHAAVDKSTTNFTYQSVFNIPDLSDTRNNQAFLYGFLSCVIGSVLIGLGAGLAVLVYKWASATSIDIERGKVIYTAVNK